MTSPSRPGPAVEPKPWQTGLAPVYIGVFLWVGFFDQIGRRALFVGGLGWSLLGAAVAGPLGYLLLYRASAIWGQQTGRGLAGVSASTFGSKGSLTVPGLLVGFGQVALFAVAVSYAVDLTFQGLALGRLIDPRLLRPVELGGASIKPPLVLATALFWAVATAMVGFRFLRWITYLMQFFPVFPAVMLGSSMLAMLGGLRSFASGGMDPSTLPSILPDPGRRTAFLLTFQWVFAFSAMAGVVGADWGAGSVDRRDVRIGGWLGMGLAPAIISALALIAIAGHQGTVQEASRATARSPLARSTIEELSGSSTGLDAPASTYRAVLSGGFERRVSCALLLVFGLGSLAPACYASFVFGERFATIGPGIPPFAWTMLGTATSWLLIVGGWSDRPDLVFHVLGAAIAPVAGAMAADYRRQKGVWPGPRRGVNPAGLISWAVGCALGLAPLFARDPDRLQPSALLAFLAAYVVYELLALCRLESAQDPDRAGPSA
jgi:cytosine permease